jgi:hypothetical protein
VSRWTVTALLACALAACEAIGDKGTAAGGDVAESGTRQGSAGGFSATMSSELAKAGIGEPVIATPPASRPSVQPIEPAGSADTGAGPALAGAADAAAADANAKDVRPSEGAEPGDGRMATAANAMEDTKAAANATAADLTAAADAKAATNAQVTATDSKSSTSTVQAVGAVQAPATRSYVKPPADIAAIKFDLEPNWERDMGEAATISLVVKVPATNDARLFSVRYGYEDQAAPADCDQYRKYLEDKGAMKVTMNRQRGAACYVEGADRGGAMAFRYLLTYGGKRLMCHGSLYKDPASAALGDLRDKVLQQAKKICETLAL